MTLKYWRASFHADSTASLPPVVKKTRLMSPGASSDRRSASSMAARVGVAPHGEVSQLGGLAGTGLGELSAGRARPGPRTDPTARPGSACPSSPRPTGPPLSRSRARPGWRRPPMRVKCIQRWRLAASCSCSGSSGMNPAYGATSRR